MESILPWMILALGFVSGQDEVFQRVTQKVWSVDDNRLCDRDLRYNADPGSGGSIFEYVNETVLSETETMVMLEEMFPRYSIYEGEADNCGCEDEERAFIKAIMATRPMQEAQLYMGAFDGGLFLNDTFFEQYLWDVWFMPYTRSGGPLDSSGFQHVFVGEITTDNDIGGFHNWIRIYREEQSNNFQFSNQIRPPCSTDIPSFSHIWSGQSKSVNSMWVRTSPEVELAICTLCHRFHPNSVCPARLDNYDIAIQTWDWQGGNSIGACYTLCS